MARLDSAEFLGKEVIRVYLAGNLREAGQAEDALTQSDIDYMVEIEPFIKHTFGILPSEFAGAAFYVLSDHATLARSTLRKAGLSAGLERDGAD